MHDDTSAEHGTRPWRLLEGVPCIIYDSYSLPGKFWFSTERMEHDDRLAATRVLCVSSVDLDNKFHFSFLVNTFSNFVSGRYRYFRLPTHGGAVYRGK